MKKGLVLTLAVLALSVAGMAGPKAKNPGFKLPWDSEVAGKNLKEGEYQVSVEGGTATISRNGKTVLTIAVRSEEGTVPYRDNNTVAYGPDGRHVAEIRLAGTTTKLLVEGPAPAASGAAGGKN
jgi:hypothetical protein